MGSRSAAFKPIKLTYFDMAGAAEKLRLALVLSDTRFEDERVPFSKWAELKPTIPYGQLPVMTIADGPTIVQSDAILRYIGRQEGAEFLYPPDKMLDIDQLIGMIGDLQRAWMPALHLANRPGRFGHPENFGKTDEGRATIKAMRETFSPRRASQVPRLFRNVACRTRWYVSLW